MKVKTADLIDHALDWAVGVAESMPIHISKQTKFPTFNKVLCRIGDDDSTDFRAYTPSTSWSQSGPIIERERIGIGHAWNRPVWLASEHDIEADLVEGPTPLVAAMRCFVASRLGNEIEIPEELL